MMVFCFSCKSQTNIIDIVNRCDHTPINRTNGNTYLKDVSGLYFPYVGTWKWSSGNREITLVLIQQIKFHYNTTSENYYEDRLVGYYIYKENGLVVADTSGDDLNSSFVNAMFSTDCFSQIGTAMFIDVKKEKMITVMLEKLSPTQMKFKGKIDQHNSYINGDKQRTLYSGSTFPLDMVFTKQ